MQGLNRKRIETVAAVVAVGHIIIAFTHGGPVAVPDVSAYLSISQWLWGGVLPAELPYFPGYGLLLAPVGFLSGSALHTAALIMNAGAAGLAVLLSARLVRRLGGSRELELVVALVAAVHPSLSTSARIAWPETMLVCSLLGVALLMSHGRWCGAGWLTGGMIVLHPRALVVLIAALICAVIASRAKRLALGLGPSLLLSLLAIAVTNTWPWTRVAATGNANGGTSFISTALGQVVAVAGSTAGLAIIGLLAGCWGYRKSQISIVGFFIATSAVGMIVVGGWALMGSSRVDTILYGRYLDPWALPLIIVGLATVQRVARYRYIWASAAVSFLAMAGSWYGVNATEGPSRRIMTLSLGALWKLFQGSYGYTLIGATAIAMVGIFITARGTHIPIVLVTVLACSSIVVNHSHLANVGRIADGQATLAPLVPNSESCLSHDLSVKGYALWLYRLQRPDLNHERVDLQQSQNLCGRYVIANSEALSNCADAQNLGVEPRGDWILWEVPVDGTCS
ncbi:MAG: hypothetical protein CL458_04390 [Acidimicrobiaceae bacterium]|nr:hypothetical protein [Acidimicrobiaceae bacterium]